MEHFVAALQTRVQTLVEKGIVPALAILQVGEDPSAANYQASIVRRADMVGVTVKNVSLAETASVEEVKAAIGALNEDRAVHGILLYLPLPKALRPYEGEICACIAPQKDADCLTDASAASVFLDGNGFAPCTAEACVRLLEHYEIPLQGKTACVVGRSRVIGKPVAMLLLRRNATVTLAHSRTEDLAAVTRQADIVIAAVGKAGLITAEHLKPGAVVVDVGANWVDGKMVGDVRFEEAEQVASAITPVPGGVGMVTSTVLMEHVVASAEKM